MVKHLSVIERKAGSIYDCCPRKIKLGKITGDAPQMYIYVKMLSGFDKELVYKVPAHLQDQNLKNQCVLVPLRNKKVSALVMRQTAALEQKATFDIKEMIGIKPFPNDPLFHAYAEQGAKLHFTSPILFYQKLRLFFKKTKEPKNATEDTLAYKGENHTYPLTDEQTHAAAHIINTLNTGTFAPTILHGVTGSGKTEVYKEAIVAAIKTEKTVLLLLPEISLANQFARRLGASLKEVTIITFHANTPLAEKKMMWQLLIKKKPLLIIGVHLPILLPISNLGLIIIDEEHEAGFEEKKAPKLNSKYLALLRAHIYKIPIVLGSATPSMQTLYNAEVKKWPLFQLTRRFSGAFPSIQLVPLLQEPKRRPYFWVSKPLEQAITSCLKEGKQVIIFLNRRGYSFFIQCKLCGFVVTCPTCSVSLTAHQKEDPEKLSLKCHYCDFTRNVPRSCEECHADPKHFLTKGIGTQQLVEILQKLFPKARIARADLDITSKKNEWEKTALMFEHKELDILVGTKSITKGYHFPGVTLVGVIWGDLHAHIPVFNAVEQCLQQLIQVAGRAGREQTESKVIVQLIHDHDMFKFINETDYLTYAREELSEREAAWYPPYCRLVKIEVRHKKAQQVDLDAKKIAAFLRKMVLNINENLTILGPAEPAIHKIQNIEIRHIFIKADNFDIAREVVKGIDGLKLKSSFFAQLV